MKKYTITLDEKQMGFIRNTMESQVKISNDVAWFAYDEYREHETDGDWREFEQGCADYYMAKTISNILNSAEGHDDTVEAIPWGDDMAKAIPGSVISSKEFANEITDYIDGELMDSLLTIAKHMYAKEYTNGMPSESDLEESVYGIRDGLVSFMQDWYGLVKSDGKKF